MVERLCRRYGTPLLPAAEDVGPACLAGGVSTPAAAGEGAAAAAGGSGKQAPGLELYAFPTLEQLAAATEEELRADGFGYRCEGASDSKSMSWWISVPALLQVGHFNGPGPCRRQVAAAVC